jgi:hypothetical protein
MVNLENSSDSPPQFYTGCPVVLCETSGPASAYAPPPTATAHIIGPIGVPALPAAAQGLTAVSSRLLKTFCNTSGLVCCLSRQNRGSASPLLPTPSMLVGARSTAGRDKADEPSGSTGREVGVCGAEAPTGLQRMPCGSRSARYAFSS